eukprot:scaffold93785_cov69-Phaeocystis_antarctica.AAC.9
MVSTGCVRELRSSMPLGRAAQSFLAGAECDGRGFGSAPGQTADELANGSNGDDGAVGQRRISRGRPGESLFDRIRSYLSITHIAAAPCLFVTDLPNG